LSPTAWVDFHEKKNLPSSYGEYRIASLEEVRTDPYRVWLFHVCDMRARPNFGLLEALLFTDTHVVFLGYFYKLERAKEARKEMDRILASFSFSPATAEKARTWYEVERLLGNERFGLFLPLPPGWFPKTRGDSGDVTIPLPSGGSLKILTFPFLSSGLKRLEERLKQKIKDLPGFEVSALERVPFGMAEGEAYRFAKSAIRGEAGVEGVLGLHGKGGYALVLRTADPGEVELFRKLSSRATLVEPAGVKPMHRGASAEFKKGLRDDSLLGVRKALSTLEMFSSCDKTAETIAGGFKACDDIQVECARSLSKMECRKAQLALERALSNGKVCDTAKKACIRGLGIIAKHGGQNSLRRLYNKLIHTLSPDVRETFRNTLRKIPNKRFIRG
jgi:hypothetical protein